MKILEKDLFLYVFYPDQLKKKKFDYLEQNFLSFFDFIEGLKFEQENFQYAIKKLKKLFDKDASLKIKLPSNKLFYKNFSKKHQN